MPIPTSADEWRRRSDHEGRGHYRSVTSAADLAQRLTADLRAVYRDGHLGIVPFDGPNVQEGSEIETLTKNDGFRKAELLPGNVGYIKFDIFMSSDEARKAAAAALASVRGCDALIFDLRDNVGGSPRMVEFIASYLFDRPTYLESFIDRSGDKMLEIRTLDEVPGQRFANDLPVYVLTSSSTVSAAEGFAYDLQHLRRATVVGATTAGAAHLVTDRLVNDRFLVHLPYLREVNPVTKGNWEGVGVTPDVRVPAPGALAAARKEAAGELRRRRKE
jgi:retinol-binding protein 3